MNDLILKARLHEQEQSVSYQLQNNFSIDKGLLENINAGQYNTGQQSPVNTRVQSGGAVRNTLGAIRDGAGAAIAGKNPFNAGNRAEVQRDRTGMTPEQQSNMVGQQNKTLEQQRKDSQIAGQNAAQVKLSQNAPGVASPEAKETMGNIQSGQDPLTSSQTGQATGGSATSFMGNFARGAKTLAQGVGNVVGAGVNAYNATQTNSGTGSAGQGTPQATLPQASTTGTGTNPEDGRCSGVPSPPRRAHARGRPPSTAAPRAFAARTSRRRTRRWPCRETWAGRGAASAAWAAADGREALARCTAGCTLPSRPAASGRWDRLRACRRPDGEGAPPSASRP